MARHLILVRPVTPLTAREFEAPFTQPIADAGFDRQSAEVWEVLRGFVSETSGDFPSPQSSPPSAWIPAPPPRVLLAHADEIRRNGLAWELGTGGCIVVEVEDGMELLDYLSDRGPWQPLPRPDIIVAEVEMPGLGGLDAAKKLRSLGDGIPFLLINAAATSALAAAHLPRTRILEGEVEGGALRAAVDEALRELSP